MTPHDQRVALARWCGWHGFHKDMMATAPNGQWMRTSDYLHDLNAVHEAEDGLPTEKRTGEGSYADWLWRLTAHPVEGGNTWYVLHATAAQRTEARLRTLELWTEDPAPTPSTPDPAP